MINSRMNRRTLGGIALGAAATSSLAYLVSAQDATPEVDGDMEASPVAMATLADLETANQVDVVANANSYAMYVGDANQPGWYVFNIENASEAGAAFNLVRLPEEVGVGDFTSFLFQFTSGSLSEVPAWLGDAVFAGGTYVPVGETGSVLVNLDAGKWIAYSDLATSTQSVTTISVLDAEAAATAGADPVATPEGGEVAPEGFSSSFTVSVADGAINADSAPAAGYNVIGVRNDASMPANFVVLHSADAIDEAAAADLATSWLAGEESGATVAGGMGVLSAGSYGYIELEAEAGTYVGFSSVMNASGGRQFEDGALVVFTV